MKRKPVLDAFHWHEARDRACMIAEIFEQYLHDHPAVQGTPALRKTAKQISDELVDFYQAVSAAEPEKD